MKILCRLSPIVLFLLFPASSIAQCTNTTGNCAQTVPHLLKFNGTLRDSNGKLRTGIVGVTFSIYADQTGGPPLWQETQNVQLDPQGRYNVLVGSATTDGVPPDLFRTSDARWMAAQVLLPGEPEQPRVLMVSVPYALRAGDAETLGGLPASSFVKLPAGDGQSYATAATARKPGVQAQAVTSSAAAAAEVPVTTPGGSSNTIAKFSVSPSIVNSQITDINGVVSLQNLANIFFADQFPDGVPGALAACPAEGCTIYAGAETVNRNLGTIDPGNKHVTIYLGPFTYTVKRIVLRSGFKMIGMGESSTNLQSVNGNNPVFVLPAVNDVTSQHVLLSGLGIIGSIGNSSEDAFFLDASAASNIGLWYSELNDIQIKNFAGIGIHLRGPNQNFGSETQWVLFNNVVVFRTPGGGNGLRIEGANFQLHFTDCEFDGTGIGEGTNIYIGGYPGGTFSFPFDITFRGLVSQSAAVGVQIDGGQTITFQTSHHESLRGAYLITANSGIYNRDISISDSVFNPNVGVNNGAGYLVNVATTLAQGIYFTHNRLGGVLGASAPDSVIAATNLSQVVYQDNEYFGSANVPPTAGITMQLVAASTINIGGTHTIGVTPDSASTPITTIQSTLGPGETVTFAAVGGSIVFAAGGNIALPGVSKVTVSGTITFIRNDLSGSQSQWWPVSQWTGSAAMPPPSGFTLSPLSTSATIAAGATANYTLSVLPSGGFTGSINFVCTMPPAATCSASPNPLDITSSAAGTEQITVATQARMDAQNTSPAGLPFGFGRLAGALWLFLPLGFFRRKQKRKTGFLLAMLAGGLALPLAGCGLGSGSGGSSGTPTGTYTIVVTAISGNIHQSVSLTVTVT